MTSAAQQVKTDRAARYAAAGYNLDKLLAAIVAEGFYLSNLYQTTDGRWYAAVRLKVNDAKARQVFSDTAADAVFAAFEAALQERPRLKPPPAAPTPAASDDDLFGDLDPPAAPVPAAVALDAEDWV